MPKKYLFKRIFNNGITFTLARSKKFPLTMCGTGRGMNELGLVSFFVERSYVSAKILVYSIE